MERTSTGGGGIRYTYNGYDQICNHLLEEYIKCTKEKITHDKHPQYCNSITYLIEKICIPGKRKMNI